MEMKVVVSLPLPAAAALDFNFDSTCSSPYITAPSSPQRFGNFFFSAPNSPNCVTSSRKRKCFYGRALDREEEEEQNNGDGGCTEDEDFEFNFSGQLERASLSAADELFDRGKIRPLKPPVSGFEQFSSAVSSPTPMSPKSRAFPIQRVRESSSSGYSSLCSSYNYVHKKSKSLSPLRVSDIMYEEDESSDHKTINNTSNNHKSYASSIFSAISFSKVNRKWKLKDLLFRSASEGRATNYKAPLTKYSLLSKKEQSSTTSSEDVRNASFRSTESVGSVSSSRRRGRIRAPVSPHELHYTANRAVSEELKRKTFLPYKQGLLGCLGFNPGTTGMHEISRGVGSLTRR